MASVTTGQPSKANVTPKYKSMKVPAIHIIAKDVIIKQAHQSFVVLGNSKDECKERNSEEADKNEEKSKPANVPFQDIDLSRLRSPNIPYIGKNANRSRPSEIPSADQNMDPYGSPKISYSARYSEEPEYDNLSNKNTNTGHLASSYPLGGRNLRNELRKERSISVSPEKRGPIEKNEQNQEKHTSRHQDKSKSVKRNEYHQGRDFKRSPEKRGPVEKDEQYQERQTLKSRDKSGYVKRTESPETWRSQTRNRPHNERQISRSPDKIRSKSPNKQLSKRAYGLHDIAYEDDNLDPIKSNVLGGKYGDQFIDSSPSHIFENPLTDENESFLTSVSSPIKYSKDKIAKESQSPFLDCAVRQKQSPHRHPSLIAHFTDETSSEEEIVTKKKKSKSVKENKKKPKAKFEKWPLKKSWVFNQTQVSNNVIL